MFASIKDSTKSALTLDATSHDASDLTARETTAVEGNTTPVVDNFVAGINTR